MPNINGNRIEYATHTVWLDADLHAAMPDYVADMAAELSPEGDARQHAAELREMHNDGSWHIATKGA